MSDENAESAQETTVARGLALSQAYDQLWHTRVSFLLLAQSVFVVAAVTQWGVAALVYLLCGFGAVVTVLFTFTNLKLAYRIEAIFFTLRDIESSGIQEWISAPSLKTDTQPNRRRWPIERRFIARFVSPASADKVPRWSDTTVLYTWVLGAFATLLWVGICLIRATT